MTDPSTGLALPAPDSPFPAHPFDPDPNLPVPASCRVWREVMGGDLQSCVYAEHDPMHLPAGKTRLQSWSTVSLQLHSGWCCTRVTKLGPHAG